MKLPRSRPTRRDMLVAAAPRPARPSITMVAVGVLTAGFLASCGGHTITGAPVEHTPPSQPAGASGEVRLGCGTYCQSAGAISGTMGPGQAGIRIVSDGTVTLDADGYLPVTVTCNLPVQCRGYLSAVNTDVQPNNMAKSDLVVNAGATATIGVGLPAQLVAYLRAHQPTGVEVTADIGPSLGLDFECTRHDGVPLPGLRCPGPDEYGPYDGFSLQSVANPLVVAAG
jgi:hypothetical protein